VKTELSHSSLSEVLVRNVKAIAAEPPFRVGEAKFALDAGGEPAVRVALANVPLEYDLWEGLRNPAGLGLHPAGLREIWEFYAWRTASQLHDESGRETMFALPLSFEQARDRFRRALIVSVMLPFSEELLAAHDRFIGERSRGASWEFSRLYGEVTDTLDRAVLRTGMDLTTETAVVVAMDRTTMDDLSAEAIPLTRQGKAHGPQKEVHYPQKSIAVLTGLAQFGVSRFVFRDEIAGGRVRRLLGPIRSLVIFDEAPLVEDGSRGIIYPHRLWREFLSSLSDFTKTGEEINRYRTCAYVPLKSAGCGKCIAVCPPGALVRSVPDPKGRYTKELHEPKRFWKGQLQFDYELCRGDRKRMATLFPEWRCGRCITRCAVAGKRRRRAVEEYEKIKRTLAVRR